VNAPADVAPWIERLARVGYVAKAVLYSTVGILAAQAALGQGGRTTDTRGALREVLGAPYGQGMLYAIAAGLAGYSVWLMVRAIADPERRGSDLKGIALRIGFGIRGVLHAGLALVALKIAGGDGGSGSDGTSEAAGTVLELPGGQILIWLAAGGIAGYGLYQLYRGFAAKLGRHLAVGELPAGTARWIIGLSRFGIAARGVVFCLIGYFLFRAADQHDPSEAGGLADSLRAVANAGRWPFLAMALGLVAYGVYELVNARYRRILVTF
jgi:hypothetical protein